jgi:hypothetical protein
MICIYSSLRQAIISSQGKFKTCKLLTETAALVIATLSLVTSPFLPPQRMPARCRGSIPIPFVLLQDDVTASSSHGSSGNTIGRFVVNLRLFAVAATPQVMLSLHCSVVFGRVGTVP